MSLRYLASVVSLVAVASAQTTILPASATGIAGNGTNSFPWGTNGNTFPGMRIQCVYDSTHFTTAPAPITAPILISNVRWRANDVATTWTGGTYSHATVALGTAAVDHAAASTNFATNVGPDYTIVHSGPVTVAGGTGAGTGVPGAYVVDIVVNPPFYYDPNQGDLVVDSNYLNGSMTSGSLVGMDVHSTNVLARRVFASSNHPLANGVDSAAPVLEIAFTPAPAGTLLASNVALGVGCVAVPDVSFYESFATSAAFDLANTSLTLLRSADGYLAIPGSAAFVPPSGSATVLALTDNSQAAVTLSQAMPVGRAATTTTLNVCSNGFITAGTTVTTGTPSATTMLNNLRAFWAVCWHDMNPALAGSGSVKFEQIGNIAYITWDGVWDNAGTSAADANTMQAQFDVVTGDVSYVYGVTSAGGNARLVGFSDASGSPNGGSIDISAVLPGTFQAASFRLAPLALAPMSRPVLGGSWNLLVTDVPATATLGIDIFGLADAGVNDLAFLGLPGCPLRATLDVLNVWLVAGNTHAHSLAIPNAPALLNVHVFANSVAFQPGVNAFGAITSNGIDGTLGDV
jgi:hypothetical protein